MDKSDTKFGRFSLISSEHSRTEYRQFMKKNCAVVFILGSHFSVMKMFWNLSLGLMFCISKREECKQDNLPPPALPTTKCIQFISKDVVVVAQQPVLQKTKYADDNTYPQFTSNHSNQNTRNRLLPYIMFSSCPLDYPQDYSQRKRWRKAIYLFSTG